MIIIITPAIWMDGFSSAALSGLLARAGRAIKTFGVPSGQ
jgi:hypothetical protein